MRFLPVLAHCLMVTSIALGGLACDLNSESKVDEQTDLPPIAKAMAIGLEQGNLAREGGEVILSAKDSDGQDSPILTFNWQANSANPLPILLKELSSNSVSFTAPKVAEATDYQFELIVIDAEGATASDSITVTVMPARDLNQFLSFDAPEQGSFAEFPVRIEPASGQVISQANQSFNLSMQVTLNYPDRAASCSLFSESAQGDVCLDYVNNATRSLSNFTQDITTQWRTNGQLEAIETQLNLPLPRLIIAEFNQILLSEGEPREALLDPWKADDITMDISISITSEISASINIDSQGSPQREMQGVSSEEAIDASLSISLNELRQLGADRVESKATALSYYQTIDPNNDADTLNKWLVKRGFARIEDGRFILNPDALSGNDSEDGEFSHTHYTNNFDLGFGRSMYTRLAPNGEVYSFVTNYSTLEGSVKNIGDFATVAMEFSVAEQDPNGEMFVKFYAFVPDESGQQIRVTDLDFDGRGQKHVPGVCASCHGGAAQPLLQDGSYPSLGNIQSAFLPWDLESFLYSDTDPAITDISEIEADTSNLVFSRAAQEEQFRKQNESVYHTYLAQDPVRFESAIGVLVGDENQGGWYTRCEPDANSNKLGCLSGNFTDNHIPADWVGEEELYSGVVARHCRACHLVLEPKGDSQTLIHQFASSNDFLSDANRNPVKELVFDKGVMPMARLTMDRFWTGDAPEILWASLGESGVVPAPGLPIAQLASESIPFHSITSQELEQDYLLTKVGREIHLNTLGTINADSFSWSLVTTTEVSGFETCINDGEALIDNGNSAILIPSLANENYCVQVTATNDVGSAVSNIVFVRAVNNRTPEVLFASICDDSTEFNSCLRVSEPNNDGQPSVINFSLNTDETPLVFDGNLINVMTLLQLFDADINAGLDLFENLEIELLTAPLYGDLTLQGQPLEALTRYSLSDLRVANALSYQATVDVSELNQIEVLNFNLYEDDQLVATSSPLTAQIAIEAVNVNAPVFTQSDSVFVDFGASIEFSLLVSDADGDALDISIQGNAKGDAQVEDQQQSGNDTSVLISYTASSATKVVESNNGSSLCTSFGVFASGGNTDTLIVSAFDGVNTTNEGVIANFNTNLTFGRTITAGFAQATASNLSGLTCGNCHNNGNATNWAGNYSVITRTTGTLLIDLGDPTASLILNPPNDPSVLDHGTLIASQTQIDDFIEWVNQCTPQGPIIGSEDSRE